MTHSRTTSLLILALVLTLPLVADAASGTTFTSGGVTRTSPFKTGATTFQVTSTFTSADASFFNFNFTSGGTLDNYGCFLGLPFGAASGMELNPPSPPYAFTNTSSTVYDGRIGIFAAGFGCTDRDYAWAAYHNRPLPAGWRYTTFPTPTQKAVFYNYPAYVENATTFTYSDFSQASPDSGGTCPSGTVLGQVNYSPHNIISTGGHQVPAESQAISTWAAAYCNKFAEANCCLIQPDFSFGSLSPGLGSSGIGGDGGNNGGYTPMTIIAVKTSETHQPTLDECMNQPSGIVGTTVSPFCQYYWGGFYVALKNPPKPDLRSSVAPTQATAGVSKKFSGTVTNNGAATTGVGYNNVMQFDDDNSLTDWEIYGSVDSTATSTMNATATAVGASKTVSAYFTIPSATPATWYYRVCTDLPPVWSGVIVESDENNNCGTWRPITVSSPPVVATSGTCSGTPSTAYVNDTVTWTAVPSGGNGTYTYAWTLPTGTPSSGTGNPRLVTYGDTGNKTASVVITSNGVSSASIACTVAVGGCSGTCITVSSSPSASCSAVPASLTSVPGDVTYTASVSGGSGSYSYTNWTPSAGSTDCEAPTGVGNRRILCHITTPGTHSMSVTANGSGGPDTGSCSLDVSGGPTGTPSAYIEADPTRVNASPTASSNISWSARNVSSCSITGGSLGTISAVVDGTYQVATATAVATNIMAQTVYTISCTPTASDTATVNVNSRIKEF